MVESNWKSPIWAKWLRKHPQGDVVIWRKKSYERYRRNIPGRGSSNYKVPEMEGAWYAPGLHRRQVRVQPDGSQIMVGHFWPWEGVQIYSKSDKRQELIYIFKKSPCLPCGNQIRDSPKWKYGEMSGSYCGQPGEIAAWISSGERQMNFIKNILVTE